MDPHENYSSSSLSTLSDEDDDITDEQLQTLQSMVPNAMRAGKRGILEETHEYLRKMREETETLEKELSQRSNSAGLSSSSTGQQGPEILSIEVEELVPGGESFVVKMNWQRGGRSETGGRGSGDVHRVISECCSDVNMTSTIVNVNNPDLMHTTTFVKVSGEMKKTEEELHDLLMHTASRFGLLP